MPTNRKDIIQKDELSNLTDFNLTKEYRALLNELKVKIRNARLKTAMTVNQEVISLYWHIGQKIIERHKVSSWGSKLIDTLAFDLQNSFPETHGFSIANLKRMKRFAEEYPSLDEISAQTVRQLPWGHIVVLMQKIKEPQEREWYAQKTFEEGWSRTTLELYLKRNLYQCQAKEDGKASNFLTKLPLPQAGLAQEILKNPYNFDFLGLHDDALEREIENASIPHITKFLIELGRGFAFVGKQVPIVIQDTEYFLDMLFYHLKLHCYVVIELKATKFKPEHTGQLNFYLNLVDDFLKTPEDKPSIGILLCKSRDKFFAEYALKGIEKPIGVSEYQLTRAIPENLKVNLPSVEEIESELNDFEAESKADE